MSGALEVNGYVNYQASPYHRLVAQLRDEARRQREGMAMVNRKRRAKKLAQLQPLRSWEERTTAARVRIQERRSLTHVTRETLKVSVKVYRAERLLALSLQADAGLDFLALRGIEPGNEIHEWDAAKGLCEPSVRATDRVPSLANRLIGDELRSEQLDALASQPYHVVEERLAHLQGSYLGISTQSPSDTDHAFGVPGESYTAFDAEVSHDSQWRDGVHVAQAVKLSIGEDAWRLPGECNANIPSERVRSYCLLALRHQHANSHTVQATDRWFRGQRDPDTTRPCTPLTLKVNGREYPTRKAAFALDSELHAIERAAKDAFHELRMAQRSVVRVQRHGKLVYERHPRKSTGGQAASSARGLKVAPTVGRPEPKLRTLIQRDQRTPWERYYGVPAGGLRA